MQRREFSRALIGAGALGAATWGTLGSGLALAQVPGLKEGSDYRKLSKPAPVDAAAGQIEVVEFFSYSCVHCYNFEPLLKDWIKTKPAHVVVRRTPVHFNAAFEPLQKIYYTLEAMDKVDELHDKVFKAMHEERVRFNDLDSIASWMAKQGLDKTKFSETFNSFGVAGKAKRATQLQDAYQVEGTPALGVAGRFYVPGQGPRTLTIANALIAEARKG